MDQARFLAKLQAYDWPHNFEFGSEVKTMVNILSNYTTLTRLVLHSEKKTCKFVI
jgi:hypothetical protein